jgi:hypothetical protein
VTAGAAPASEPFRAGHYARREVEVAASGGQERPFELSLALPFGALFSTLLASKAFRVRSLSLDYVALERLGARPTFSAKVSGGQGAADTVELSLLVSQGAWVCVRGAAVLELSVGASPAGVVPQPPASGSPPVDRSSNGKLA